MVKVEKNVDMLRYLLLTLSLLSLCGAATEVTYSFPSDTCVDEPHMIDENDVVHLTFDGDFGRKDCRRVSFKVPENPFYRYRICTKQLYYESKKCQSSLRYKPLDPDDVYSNYYGRETIKSSDCQQSYYADDGFAKCTYDTTMVEFVLMKNFKENDNSYNRGYHHYSNEKLDTDIPDHVNDTFRFQLEAKLEYRYDVIGGVAGGIAGLFLLIGTGTCLFFRLRRRKRLTGKYCNVSCCHPTSFNYETLKDGISEGFSTEVALGGITLCACILCRRKKRDEEHEVIKANVEECRELTPDVENKWEKDDGLKDPDIVPLLVETS